MTSTHKNILIIADIEGSSACFDYESTTLMGRGWPEACLGMTRDVDATVRALFNAGADRLAVKDFHRTGYNMFPEMVDSRASFVPGYRRGPVPGIGDPDGATALFMIGMHAPSGSGGFLAHTMTSRIAALKVNGRLLSEAELFSASLAQYGVRPVFFSGCPAACAHAEKTLPGITIFPIDKSEGKESFDGCAWRKELAVAAARAAVKEGAAPHDPPGPFEATVTMRDGPAAARTMAEPWGFRFEGDNVILAAVDLRGLYNDLIMLCYFKPFLTRILPAALLIYNIYGRLGLAVARRRCLGWKNTIKK